MMFFKRGEKGWRDNKSVNIMIQLLKKKTSYEIESTDNLALNNLSRRTRLPIQMLWLE